jgi:hypothetical protein
MDWKSSDSSARTWSSGLKGAGSSLRDSGSDMMSAAREQMAANANRQTPIPSYKRGGKVRKTGLARLHKGEYVVPRNQVKKVMRKMKSRMRSR